MLIPEALKQRIRRAAMALLTPEQPPSTGQPWDNHSYDISADIQRQIQRIEDQSQEPVTAKPDPEVWESCAGLNRTGICPRSIPISGHVLGTDGGWWHVRGQHGPAHIPRS